MNDREDVERGISEWSDFMDKLHERKPKEYYELTLTEISELCVDFLDEFNIPACDGNRVTKEEFINEWLRENLK